MADGLISVLLIEDNPGEARLIQEALAEAKGARINLSPVRFNLEPVDRLSKGLQRLAAGGIDVVLLDLALPDSQGLDTLAQTRAAAPEMPIVVLTGLNDEALAIEAVEEGAQDYLVKGQADGNLLARSLRFAIERKRATERVRAQEPQVAPPADLDAALIVVGGDWDLLREVVIMSLEAFPEEMDALREALARQNAPGVKRAAHTLKGALGNLGAGAARSLAQRLETMGHEGNLGAGAARSLAQRLETMGQEGNLSDASAVLEELEVEMARLVAFFSESGWEQGSLGYTGD